MALERKILLSILCLIVLIFSSYIFYNSFYLRYQDAINKTENYNKLIDNHKPIKSIYTNDDIGILINKIEQYKSSFFSVEDAKLTILTPYIKDLLISYGITITQYQNSKQSVRFTISGTINSLLKFMYKIYIENKFYSFPVFNIKMIDNNNFKGTIDIKRLVLENDVEIKSDIKIIDQLKLPYDLEIVTIFGTSFYKPITKTIKQDAAIEIIPIKKITLNKFTYVGLLKSDTKTITMFKENINNRIYKFKTGQTIDEWTYIGVEDNKFIFKNKEILYEVIKWEIYMLLD